MDWWMFVFGTYNLADTMEISIKKNNDLLKIKYINIKK